MKIEWWPIDRPKPYPNNPRINDNAVQAVADSIQAFGWQQPIVVDTDGVVIAGHTRLKAARLLGKETVPVHVASHLTPDEAAAYRLADNASGEKAAWDMEALKLEFKGIQLDMSPWFGKQDMSWATKDGAKQLKDSDKYLEWLKKFDTAKTTDDCYTPANVYDAVAEWVEREYGVPRERFVRPFRPGGDYKTEEYADGCAVVDNPPFSIMAEIIRYYTEKTIPFFLFANSMTLFSAKNTGVTYIPVGVSVTYDNGATVNTSFVTNMENGYVLRTAPSLYEAVDTANDENMKSARSDLPKYEYPDNIVTAALAAKWCKYGVDYRIRKDDCLFVSALDAQKEKGVGIYGGGLLLSERAAAERAAAERAAAERAAAERWQLSEREKSIVSSIGQRDA